MNRDNEDRLYDPHAQARWMRRNTLRMVSVVAATVMLLGGIATTGMVLTSQYRAERAIVKMDIEAMERARRSADPEFRNCILRLVEQGAYEDSYEMKRGMILCEKL